MKIIIKDDNSISQVEYWIKNWFEQSRFTFTLDFKFYPKPTIKILNVRLKQNKAYCGNHPNACEFTFFERKHKKSAYLEGADWVEFNDTLNDCLDANSVKADVSSSVCVIRKDTRRRVDYDSSYVGNFFQWNKYADDEYYQDYCKQQAPRSSFPDGTPGIYESLNYNEVG